MGATKLTSVLAAAAVSLAAQAPPASPAVGTPASFEVASVKVNRSSQAGGLEDYIPAAGQVRIVNQTLRQVIRAAYGFEINRILGGPGWIDTDRFDIQARAAAAVPRDALMSMMRTLLADRFKLVAHVEPRQQPIWALVPSTLGGGTGTRLRVAAPACTDGCGRISAGPGRMSGRSVSLDQFATMLAPRVGRLVVQRTGLTGLFDFDLEWGLDEAQAAALAQLTPLGATPPSVDQSRPGIFTALQEQLGLRLDSVVGPVEVVVIDGAQPPTED